MDQAGEVREQMRAVQAAANHTQRLSEHTVLDRLMYKNRSQHRRAPYFRRLDHVRRALRRAGKHRAWAALKSLANSSGPLAFSSVTINDVDDLAAVTSEICSRIIPNSARCLSAELICRGHFIPFSVAVVSNLARLYAIERRVCTELVAAASQLRVLLAVDERIGLENSGLAADEDLGEPVEVPGDESNLLDDSVVKPAKGAGVSALPNEMPQVPCSGGNLRNVTYGAAVRSSSVRSSEPAVPPASSLYELIALDDQQAAKSLQVTSSSEQVVRTRFERTGDGNESHTPGIFLSPCAPSEGLEDRVFSRPSVKSFEKGPFARFLEAKVSGARVAEESATRQAHLQREQCVDVTQDEETHDFGDGQKSAKSDAESNGGDDENIDDIFGMLG